MVDPISSIALGVSYSISGIGPVNTEIMRRGVKHGFLSGFSVTLGATLVDLFYLSLIFTGLSFVINIPFIQTLMYSIGFVVLIYLGTAGVKDYFRYKVKISKKEKKRNGFISGILLGFSSPAAFIWYIGFFGPMLASLNFYFAFQSGLFMILGLVLGEAMIALISHFGKQVLTIKILKYVSAISGIILILFGIYFGYQAVLSVL